LYIFHSVWIKFDTGALYEKLLSDFALREIGAVEAMLYLWVCKGTNAQNDYEVQNSKFTLSFPTAVTLGI